jgi:hypothetical protein
MGGTAVSLLREDRVMADNEPRWQSASDFLLVVAVAAAPVLRSISPVGSPALPRADDDPREYLAHMMAVMHRRGLPLPASEGRVQSLIDQSVGQRDEDRSVP